MYIPVHLHAKYFYLLFNATVKPETPFGGVVKARILLTSMLNVIFVKCIVKLKVNQYMIVDCHTAIKRCEAWLLSCGVCKYIAY